MVRPPEARRNAAFPVQLLARARWRLAAQQTSGGACTALRKPEDGPEEAARPWRGGSSQLVGRKRATAARLRDDSISI